MRNLLRRGRPWLFHVIGPLLLGSVLYVAYRSDTLLVWEWARAAGLEPVLSAIRLTVSAAVPSVPEAVAFTVPDGLWVYAMSFAVARVWRRGSSIERVGWLAIPVLFGVGAELGQGFGLVPGTFDSADLLLCAVATAAGMRFGLRRPTDDTAPDAEPRFGEERT